MDYIELDTLYNISNVDTTWVGVVDINNNIANVKIGNSDVFLSVPVTDDITNSILTYFNVT
jgi:hypothetical protein